MAVVAIASATALFSATGTVILNILVATHTEKALSRNTLVFAGVNVVASYAAIQAYGAVGAAAVALAISAASQVSLAMLPSTRLYVRASLKAAVRPFAAVAIAIVVARVIGLQGWASAGATLAVYLVAIAALGILGREEWRLVQSLAPGRRA